MIRRYHIAGLLGIAALLSTTPAMAQEVRGGRVAGSSVGEAGRRQTRDQAATNIAPLSRISTRINNRVQSRIRNRIDRNYDPQANAVSPFAVAQERTRRR